MPDKQPKTGIVHLGLGAFFRAFGCVYVADAMAASGGDWGIVGVSMRSPAVRDALRPQGWAYTSVTLGPGDPIADKITVLNAVLVAPEAPQAVLDAMVDQNTKIVSLTVTEKGYCHNPATGRLNINHPDIQHDLTHELPKSALGFLVRALARRRDKGLRPFTVLSCDNLPKNGQLLRGLVFELAALVDPSLADWIAAETRFPSTMVDRITPATTQDDIDKLASKGISDAAPIMHEPFAQWAIEDDFVDGLRPDFEAAGAEMVTDVAAHEDMKLRMLNGTHSALAYAGYLGGHQTIADTVADPVYAAFARALWNEIAPTVSAPTGVNLTAYADALFDRYANPNIRHKTWQIAMDGSQKLPQRILGTLRDTFAAGRDAPMLCLAVAAWMRYVSGRDEQGQPIDVVDPMAARLRELSRKEQTPHTVALNLLSVREIFPEDLAELLSEPMARAAEAMWTKGSRAAIAAHLMEEEC